ncbi:MAG: DUF4124 domain-containing protein [Candidatus Cloacimonadaceae bacterium]
MKVALWVLALAPGICLGAGIYKWVDESGKVRFGDKPPTQGEAEHIPKDALKPNTSDGDHCQTQYTLAKAVMRDRQAGRPMPEIMALYAHQDGESAYRAIVRAAYAQPRYSTPSYQSREIFDFSSEVYRVCLETSAP